MNEKRRRCIKTINYLMNGSFYYIGPKCIGHYGLIDSNTVMSFKDIKYLAGNIKEILYFYQKERESEVLIALDKKAIRLCENLYINGKENVFFINESDESIWTHYFNKDDSKILLKYFRRAGKKFSPEIKEELFKVISEYKLKKFYDKFCHNKTIFIDGREKKFSSYRLFKNEFKGWVGFGGKWKLEAPEAPDYLIIRQHYMAAFDWWTID